MGTRRALALVTSLTFATGCFGYSHHAKGWAYVGDAILIAGGGTAIALDQTSTSEPCMTTTCPYKAPISGVLVAGVALAAAGLVGIIINATRPDSKPTGAGR
ncbi:MAG TPA: hypothetical protein VGM88_07905 [Kofleriaceae bacterium]|jgi:hypothetical protein